MVEIAYSQNLNFIWVKQLAGLSADKGYAATTDALGNVYCTGTFSGTTDFDPGTGVYNLIAGWDTNVYVCKLNSAGNFIWAKQFEGLGNKEVSAITVDDSGNVYTVGNIWGGIDLDPGTSSYGFYSLGASDIFISKLDSSGNFVWGKHIGGNYTDGVHDIHIDNKGNIYATGFFTGTVDFNPDTATFNLNGVGNYNVFILKLNADGNFVWAKQLGGNYDEEGYGITTDSIDNVYTTGYFSQTTDFDPGAGYYPLTALPNGTEDIFVSKLDSVGNFVWAKQMGGKDYDEGYGIAIDSHANIITSGYFRDTADFDPGIAIYNQINSGYLDMFISKLDSAGNFVWAKQFSVNAWNTNGPSIVTDKSGNIYTTGNFTGTVDFNPGASSFTLTAAGTDNIFISKLDSSGNFVWAGQLGGTSSSETSESIYVDNAYNIYTTGWFYTTVDFDPGTSAYNLTSIGSWDAFVHKMSQSFTGIEENNEANILRIFPNPFNSSIFIAAQNLKTNSIEITIKNVLGQTVLNQQENNLINSYTKTIDLNFLAKGIYLLDVIIDGERTVKKISKE